MFLRRDVDVLNAHLSNHANIYDREHDYVDRRTKTKTFEYIKFHAAISSCLKLVQSCFKAVGRRQTASIKIAKEERLR